MSEVVQRANLARKKLADALARLQGEGVPEELLGVAKPIAAAMRLLLELEEAPEIRLAALSPRILVWVQQALAQLQQVREHRSRISAATALVAEALGAVHGITQLAVATGPVSMAVGTDRLGAPVVTPESTADTLPELEGESSPDASPAPDTVLDPGETEVNLDLSESDGTPLSVDTSLGAHSSNNFYRGLGGRSVLQHGGLFIATYSPPTVGQALRLRVLMPGGFEFTARAIVRWCRDAPQTASTAPYAPPGYGAQLYDVSEEGRRLIERYVENREPLLHD